MKVLRRVFRNRLALAACSIVAIVVALAFNAYMEASIYIDRELGRLEAVGEPLAPRPPRPMPPAAENAAPLYEAAAGLCVSTGRFSPVYNCATVLDGDPEGSRRDIAAAAPALDLLAQAMARPACVYPPLDSTRPPDFVAIRRMAQLSALKALLDVRARRNGEALATTAQMLRFEGTYERRTGLIEEMVMVACLDRTLEPLEAMADQGVRADYRTVLETLATARSARAERFTDWISIERINGLRMFRTMTREQALETTSLDSTPDCCLMFAYALAPRVMLRVDEGAWLQCLAEQEQALGQAMLDINTRDWSEARLSARRQEVARAFHSPPTWAAVTRSVIANGGRAFEQMDRMLHRMDVLAARLRALQE
jgi:hypothetical protein